MKRERSETEPRRVAVRQVPPKEMLEEEPLDKHSSKSTLVVSLAQRVYETLDGLSRLLKDGPKSIDEERLADMQELLQLVGQGMTIEEMFNLDYSNRLHFLRKTIDRRNLKTKNWLTLAGLLDQEIQRVHKAFMGELQNFDSLLQLKGKFLGVKGV
jgi:hypothetical protein